MIFWRIWTHPPRFDGSFAGFITINQYDDDQAFFFVVPNQLLSNPGGLIRRRLKVMAGSVFWRR